MKLKLTISETICTLDQLVKDAQTHIDEEPHETTKNVLKIAKDHIQQALVVLETVRSDRREREMRDIQEGRTFKR